MQYSSATAWNEARRARGGGAGDEGLVRKDFLRKLQRLAAQLPFAEDLLTAYYCAFDRNTPTHVRTVLLGALAYFVMPLDFMPDLLPLVGFSDDAAVIAAALRVIWVSIQPAHRDAARETLAQLKAQ